MVTDSFARMLVISAVLGAANGFAGMYLSYFLDSSSGATIVLLGACIFGCALLYASARDRLAGMGRPAHARQGPAEATSVVYD
jgi:manganese transport system permease protein